MAIELRTPDKSAFEKISSYIHEYELDDRELKQDQFIAAFRQNELVGFGRIREHQDCSELCSLGVITNERRKGIGRTLVKALIDKASAPLYLVCIIPDFFEPLHFQIISEEIPLSIKDKINYCTSELVVPEKYVAMKYFLKTGG